MSRNIRLLPSRLFFPQYFNELPGAQGTECGRSRSPDISRPFRTGRKADIKTPPRKTSSRYYPGANPISLFATAPVFTGFRSHFSVWVCKGATPFFNYQVGWTKKSFVFCFGLKISLIFFILTFIPIFSKLRWFS